MTTYSPNEIAGLIYLVGGWGPGSKDKAPEFLDVAIAVCLAESGGNSDAYNPPATRNTDGSYKVPEKYAVGLWQIMFPVHKDLLRQYAHEYANSANSSVAYTHPLVNTSVARDLQKSQGWSPWVAYTSGSYKKHLGHGQAAYKYISKKENLETLQASIGTVAIPDQGKVDVGASWQEVLSHAYSGTLDFFKQAGITVGIFLLGAVLIILGVWFLLSRTRIVKGAIAKTPAGLVKDLVK